MKVIIRRSSNKDLDKIYDLQCRCFSQYDSWYKSHVANYLKDGLVVELDGSIIAVLLQGKMTPCNRKFSYMDCNYKEDIFESVSETGKYFQENDLQFEEMHGIVMICVDGNYRGKGLAKKLIEKHFLENKGKVLCLNTRRTNTNAYDLYKKMGYEHIAFIKNKYFLPDEDSIFMIKDNAE
jgi:ribosomal protein S18 acetylase RimI-like enzyme